MTKKEKQSKAAKKARKVKKSILATKNKKPAARKKPNKSTPIPAVDTVHDEMIRRSAAD